MIDAHIQRGLYGDALRIIEELRDNFNKLTDLDVSDQLLHVRVLSASARIRHYDSLFHQALRKWEVALTYVQTYKSFDGEGFTHALIHLSISLAQIWQRRRSSEGLRACGDDMFQGNARGGGHDALVA